MRARSGDSKYLTTKVQQGHVTAVVQATGTINPLTTVQPLRFHDLRAGDTIYVTSVVNPEGVEVVTRIRKAPITVEQLRRRYLRE